MLSYWCLVTTNNSTLCAPFASEANILLIMSFPLDHIRCSQKIHCSAIWLLPLQKQTSCHHPPLGCQYPNIRFSLRKNSTSTWTTEKSMFLYYLILVELRFDAVSPASNHIFIKFRDRNPQKHFPICTHQWHFVLLAKCRKKKSEKTKFFIHGSIQRSL